MDTDKRDLLARVAYLYYVENQTQSQIAKTLGIYRTTISRLLKQARETGVVSIQINDFDVQRYQLETALKQRFQLQQLILVPTNDAASQTAKNQALALAAAKYLKHVIRPQAIVGFAWGSALANMVGQLQQPLKTDATFVPLVGGPSPANAQYHVNGIVYDAARQFGGRSLFVDVTAVQESKYIRDGIINAQYFQTIQRCWDQLDIAFVGIGGPLTKTTSRWRDLLTDADRTLLQDRGAVGDCCCTFYDRKGKILTGDLLDRTIAIPLHKLKRVPQAVGVARSLSKVPAIKALLDMHLLNTLITDEETAQRLLAVTDSERTC